MQAEQTYRKTDRKRSSAARATTIERKRRRAQKYSAGKVSGR